MISESKPPVHPCVFTALTIAFFDNYFTNLNWELIFRTCFTTSRGYIHLPRYKWPNRATAGEHVLERMSGSGRRTFTSTPAFGRYTISAVDWILTYSLHTISGHVVTPTCSTIAVNADVSIALTHGQIVASVYIIWRLDLLASSRRLVCILYLRSSASLLHSIYRPYWSDTHCNGAKYATSVSAI